MHLPCNSAPDRGDILYGSSPDRPSDCFARLLAIANVPFHTAIAGLDCGGFKAPMPRLLIPILS